MGKEKAVMRYSYETTVCWLGCRRLVEAVDTVQAEKVSEIRHDGHQVVVVKKADPGSEQDGKEAPPA